MKRWVFLLIALIMIVSASPIYAEPAQAAPKLDDATPTPAGEIAAAAEQPAGLVSEARYYELEPIDFSFQNREPTFDLTSSRARVMVSFHPADKMAERKPLFIFLNGGPGCPSTIGLLAMNTSPYTLDENRVGGKMIKENPYTWTQMGNLLYIDAPNTGFSYMLDEKPEDGKARAANFDAQNFNVFIDAAQVLRVVLRFMADHPVLQDNPVVIVGESYSGTRTTTMLNLLLNYQGYGDGSRIFKDAGLTSVIQKHLDTVFPAEAGKRFTPADVARQFGRQVLVEPELTGEYASLLSGEMLEAKDSLVHQLAKEKNKKFVTCAEGAPAIPGIEDEPCHPYANALAFVYLQAGRDLYFYTKPNKFGDTLDAFAKNSITHTDVFTKIMGTDPLLIPELAPEGRKNAYRYKDDAVEDMKVTVKDLLPPKFKGGNGSAGEAFFGQAGPKSLPLDEALGKLAEWDDYYTLCSMSVYHAFYKNKVTEAGYRIDPESPLYGELFLNNLPYVKVLITDAAQDLMIYAPSIPPSFKKYTELVKDVQLERGSKDQPDGFFKIFYKEDALKNQVTPASRTVYFPHYDPAGHAVPVAQPEKLRADVREWMTWVAE